MSTVFLPLGGMRVVAIDPVTLDLSAANMAKPIENRAAGPTFRPGQRNPGTRTMPPEPRWARKRGRR